MFVYLYVQSESEWVRVKGLAVRSPNGGGDEERERERGGEKERERGCVCVVKSSVRGMGGDVKVKYINHSLAGLITSVRRGLNVRGYTVFVPLSPLQSGAWTAS